MEASSSDQFSISAFSWRDWGKLHKYQLRLTLSAKRFKTGNPRVVSHKLTDVLEVLTDTTIKAKSKPQKPQLSHWLTLSVCPHL
jgi:hypothetical protein